MTYQRIVNKSTMETIGLSVLHQGTVDISGMHVHAERLPG